MCTKDFVTLRSAKHIPEKSWKYLCKRMCTNRSGRTTDMTRTRTSWYIASCVLMKDCCRWVTLVGLRGKGRLLSLWLCSHEGYYYHDYFILNAVSRPSFWWPGARLHNRMLKSLLSSELRLLVSCFSMKIMTPAAVACLVFETTYGVMSAPKCWSGSKTKCRKVYFTGKNKTKHTNLCSNSALLTFLSNCPAVENVRCKTQDLVLFVFFILF